MRRAVVLAVLVACGGARGVPPGSGSGSGVVESTPKAPGGACQDAAAKLVALGSEDGIPLDAAAIAAECVELGLAETDARCLANAKDKLGAAMCPQPLGRELRATEATFGVGPCRPVLVVTALASRNKMRELEEAVSQGSAPPSALEDAQAMFDIVSTELGSSCRTEDWGKEAMTCFGTSDAIAAIACIDKVPPAIIDGIDARIKARLQPVP